MPLDLLDIMMRYVRDLSASGPISSKQTTLFVRIQKMHHKVYTWLRHHVLNSFGFAIFPKITRVAEVS